MKNIHKNIITSSKTFLAMSLLAANVGSYADDTEVFYSLNVSKPNLMFVLDISGSMNSPLETSGAPDISTHTQRTTNGSADISHPNNSTTISNGDDFIDLNNSTYGRFRFDNIDIPQGSSITNAYIQFQSTHLDTGAAEYLIYLENVDDANQVGSVFDEFVYLNAQNWEPGDWHEGERGDDQKTNNLSAIVQEVIGRVGWQVNNSLAFYLHNTKDRNRRVATFENNNYEAAELVIEYANAKSRLDVMKESFRSVLEQAPDNVKIGLMNYGQEGISPELSNTSNHRNHAAGGVAFPATDINTKVREVIPTVNDAYNLPFPDENITVRDYIADIADSWTAVSDGFTPIPSALYETALYYRGERMHYGESKPELNGAHPSTYDGAEITFDVRDTSGPGRNPTSAPKYNSPITGSCQENYVVLMTDGQPTYRYRNSNGSLRLDSSPFALNDGPVGALPNAINNCATAEGVGIQGNCSAELTHFIANTDNLPDPSSAFPNGLEDDQIINTFAIGFATGAGTPTEAYLKSIVTYDDGDSSTDDDGYFLAESPEELAAAFRDIFEEVAAPKGTLASPGYSVNVRNGLEHEKDVYIPVFDRGNSSRWSGNLKKFKIIDTGDNRVIVGRGNIVATDELGNFTSDAIDYWSTSTASDPDGSDVERGGVANLIDPVGRKVFSNLSGNTNAVLSAAGNQVDLGNISNLTNDVLGLPAGSDLAYRKQIVSFMRGWEDGISDPSAIPAPEKRYHMGDMLHSEPLILTYEAGTGANRVGRQQYIFAGTNEGYLHAIDAETGEEVFAFIPKDLLGSISEPQFLNAGTEADHAYGIDGSITGDVIGGEDGSVDPGDQVIIYFGMRRGGRAYYAMDVTNPNAPVLLWKKSAEDHPSMGQTWGAPFVAKVGNSSGTPQEVLIVGGGYDEDEDRDKNDGSQEVEDSTVAVTATEGNDVLIFDAKLGTTVWSMPQEMRDQITSSIAGGIKPLDTNNNNLIDRIYFGDTGGNLWRLDLSENNGDTTRPDKLTKLAAIGGTGANNRMFFNEPDVALMRLNGRSVYAVSIGSGFRAHPLDREIDDKFYVFIDSSPFSPLETTGSNSFVTITEADLATVTVTSDGQITNNGLISDVDKRGFLVNLPEHGEKVLGDATAINGSIIFPTLVPQVLASGVGIDQCAAPVTFSRLYAIDILSATAKWNFDEDESPEPFTEPLTAEIISSTDKVFNTPEPNAPVLDDNGNPTGETECSHTVDLRVGKKSSQVTGYNACRLESVYWSDPAETNN